MKTFDCISKKRDTGNPLKYKEPLTNKLRSWTCRGPSRSSSRGSSCVKRDSMWTSIFRYPVQGSVFLREDIIWTHRS